MIIPQSKNRSYSFRETFYLHLYLLWNSNFVFKQPYQMNRRNEDQYGVVRAVREYDEFGKKKLHP